LRAKTKVVLMSPEKPDVATKSNAKLLGQFFAPEKIFALPWLGKKFELKTTLKNPQLKRALRALLSV